MLPHILEQMRDDDIGEVVRSDPLIRQMMAQQLDKYRLELIKGSTEELRKSSSLS